MQRQVLIVLGWLGLSGWIGLNSSVFAQGTNPSLSSSKIDLSSALSCYFSLRQATGAESGYLRSPKGQRLIAIDAKRKGSKGVYIFDEAAQTPACFLKSAPEMSLEPVDGEIMELWAEVRSDLPSYQSKCNETWDDQVRGVLAQRLMSTMLRYSSKASPAIKKEATLVNPPPVDPEKVLSQAFQSPLLPNTVQQEVIEDQRVLAAATSTLDPDEKRYMAQSVETQITVKSLMEGLQTCEKVKDEPRVSKLATALLKRLQKSGGEQPRPRNQKSQAPR